MTAELTTTEVVLLAEHEGIIREGMQTFVEVGSSLAIIRNKRLYRQEYPNFEAYCKGKWSIEKRQAYRLIEAAGVVEKVSHGTQQSPILPSSERQARELAKAPEEEQSEVWQEAVETAPKDKDGKPKVTAKHVEETVKRRSGPKNIIPVPEDDEPTAEESTLAEMESRNKTLNQWSKRLASLLNELPEMAYLRRDQISSNVKVIKSIVRDALADSICPKCQGGQCGTCLNTGFITKPKKQELEG